MVLEIEVFVIYEDSAPIPKEFGPHTLLCAAVADRIGQDLHQVRRRVSPIPTKGSGNLVKVCCRDGVERLSRRGQPVVALIDEDRVRELLGLSKSACRPSVLQTMRDRTGAPAALQVVLLEDNVEDLVRAAGAAMTLTEEQLVDATERKRINARDRILNRCATGSPDLRRAVLDRMPSFARLVRIVAAALERPHSS